MGNWQDVRAHFKRLTKAAEAGEELKLAWRAYQQCVLTTKENPPYHLIAPIRLAQDAAARRGGMNNVRILDHGCGGGGTLLFLLALGFTGIYGVDVGGPCTVWNRLLKEEFGIAEQRFFLYDGRILPFEDDLFDLLLSEEVVEHVPDALISAYYDEGRRVLRVDGAAYFAVPHRLVPYDSHTRTWLLHYFPRTLASRLHRAIDAEGQHVFDNHLHLRWPRFHLAMLQNRYATTMDITAERLSHLKDFDYYDGPLALRRWLSILSRIPAAGVPLTQMFAKFIMLQTLSQKTAGRPVAKIFG